MTVKELIEKLKDEDGELEVVCMSADAGGVWDIYNVEKGFALDQYSEVILSKELDDSEKAELLKRYVVLSGDIG